MARAWRAREDQHLYELYGHPLEQKHEVQYLAIGPEGQTILGNDMDEVLQEAIRDMGSGKFALVRLGYTALGRCLAFDHGERVVLQL